MEFLILQAINPFLNTIKSLSITFYLYLNYTSINPERKFININNLIAEIRKVKRIEKEIALNNTKKTISFRRKWHQTDKIISMTQIDCGQEF